MDGVKDVKSKVDAGAKGAKTKVDVGPSSFLRGFLQPWARRKDSRQKAQGSIRNQIFFFIVECIVCWLMLLTMSLLLSL